MKTAVIERVGKIIRFNENYLDFLRQFHIVPVACNVRAAWEKGKIEKGGIHYIRHNFWPCRNFRGLTDVNRQAREWLDKVANVRTHATTGERPVERYQPDKMRPLPPGLNPDPRDKADLRVHTDTRIQFDGNYYSVPPWAIGKKVTVKGDNEQVSVYYKIRLIAVHTRSWERKKVTENPKHIESVLKSKNKAFLSKQEEIFFSLGGKAEKFLEGLANAGKSLERSVAKLLSLKDRYGKEALLKAMEIACQYGAYGLDYVENILYQQTTPVHDYFRVVLKNRELNKLRLGEVDLKEYDNFILEKRLENERNRNN